MKTHLIVLLVFIVCESVSGERVSDAVKGQFPYYVSLRNKHKALEHFCSGVIVNSYLILSSNWCANIIDAEHIEAHFGKVSDFESDQRIGIKKTMIYKPEPDKSVALFYTKERIPFSESIQPISLQPRNQWGIPHKKCIVLGWDHRTHLDPASSLKYKFTTLDKCHMQNPEIFSCTWDDNAPSVPNPWPDIGSSIVDNTNSDKPYLVGLVMHSKLWSADGDDFAYIRVSTFAAWIEDNEKVITTNDALWPLSHATSFAVTFVIIACFILPIAFTYMKYLSQRQKEANMLTQPQLAPANPVPRVRVAHISRMIPPRIPAYPGLSRSSSDDTSTPELPPSYDSLFPADDDDKPKY